MRDRRTLRFAHIIVAIGLVLVCGAAIGGSLPELAYTQVAPGVTYAEGRIAEGTLDDSAHEIRVVRIRRDERTVTLDAAAAFGVIPGVATLTNILARESASGDRIVAAVNADFFRMSGQTQEGLMLGTMVAGGELIRTNRQQECFYLTDDRTPGIAKLEIGGEVRARGWSAPVLGVNCDAVEDGVTLYTAAWGWSVDGPFAVAEFSAGALRSQGQWTGHVVRRLRGNQKRVPTGGEVFMVARGAAAVGAPTLHKADAVSLELAAVGLSSPVQMAVGGRVVLVKGGMVAAERSSNDRQHPRTAVGYNEDEIILFTCDGRQPGWSVGLYLDQMAGVLLELGCTEALNLDGGGSTTMIVDGRVGNRPSGGIQRMISNAVLVRSSAGAGGL